MRGSDRFVSSLLALGLGLAACGDPRGPVVGRSSVDRVERTLLLEEARLSVEGGEAPKLSILAPSKRRDLDTSPLPCLELAPGQRARIDLTGLSPEATLRLAGGLSASSYAGLGAPSEVRFRALLDGTVVLSGSRRCGTAVPQEERTWLRAAPLSLAGARELVLELEADPGADGVRGGFGPLDVVLHGEVEHRAASRDHPNVLMIVIDTLRADHVGERPEAPSLTPHLDELAGAGVTFEEAWAASPWTWPSTASLLTGKSPMEHGVLSYESCYLAPELVTLAEELQDGGWRTAAWSANPLVQPDKQFDQGFAEFTSYRWAPGGEIAGDVESWIRARHGESPGRWFAYVHLTDPHEYVPSPPFREDLGEEYLGSAGRDELYGLLSQTLMGRTIDQGRFDVLLENQVRAYAATVREADAAVGRLLSVLTELDLDEETLIVVTSDHGEEFMEHGLLYHGSQLHEELVAAPLLARGPFLPRGHRVDRPVENRQVPRLVLEQVGLRERGPLEDLATEGPLFFTTSLGIARPKGRPTEVNQTIHGARTEQALLLWQPEGGDPESGGRITYFDLREDGRAAEAVLPPIPPEGERLLAQLKGWIADGLARRPRSIDGGAAVRSELDAMGYTR